MMIPYVPLWLLPRVLVPNLNLNTQFLQRVWDKC